MLAAKHAVACAFGAASTRYESAARLQRQMGDALLATLNPPTFSPAAVVDLGCGTGWFTRRLAQRFGVQNVTGMDLSGGMLSHARANSAGDIGWIQADAEHLPLADHSMDVVFSNLMIQWCQNPQQVLRECQRVLRPGGQLRLSTLLYGSLRELQQAWALADPNQSHVNQFSTANEVAKLAACVLPGAQLRSAVITLDYPTPMALMGELKQLGAGYKDSQRRKTATAPGRLKRMSQNYPRQVGGGIVASYHGGWLAWQKPR